jgi:hypothetical protein
VAKLSLKELSKRNNFYVFAKRIAIGQGFYVINNDKLVVLHPNILENIIDIQDLNKYKINNSIVLPTIDGEVIKLSSLYKDSEFANRTQNSTARQDAEIFNLSLMMDTIKEQTEKDYVTIKIINNVYHVKSIKVLGDKSKADFCFMDLDNKRVGFVSHKYGTSPKDFQQWSGTSKRFQNLIADHPETISFISDLKNLFKDGCPRASTVARKIIDPELKKVAVFGNEFGLKFSKDNVEAVMQGELALEPSGEGFLLSGSHYTIPNGELPLYGYDPVFMAVHKKDRADHWIPNCRVTINPIGSRKIKQFI